jgi:hypothetical protein
MPKTKTRAKPERAAVNLDATVNAVAERVRNARSRRHGTILLRLTGPGGGDYAVQSTEGTMRVLKEIPHAPHQFEVIGDARRIQAILEGKKEGRAQFFAGGIRIRGDLQYLSELAHELGLIKEPF